jgi:abequosyltransferase
MTMSTLKLSICIPTYNRAFYLTSCLESLSSIAPELWPCIEVVVSDNASTDNTLEIVEQFKQRFPIRYFRNETNIGGERNIHAATERATAPYAWVLGDDDEFDQPDFAKILAYIEEGFDLLVVNYSTWSKDMDELFRDRGLPGTSDESYFGRNAVLETFGPHLGYVSSIIGKKEVMLAAPNVERDPYVAYGFSHMFSIYYGLPEDCRVRYLSAPVVRRRENNCLSFIGEGAYARWIKVFVEGTAKIFEDMEQRGYSHKSVLRAKNRTLKDFGIGNIIAGLDTVSLSSVRAILFKHYHGCRLYWTRWFPVLLLPASLSSRLYARLRRMRGLSPLGGS